MRRADMVKKLSHYLNTTEDQAYAEAIINFLEMSGMFPPVNENDYCHHDNDDRKALNAGLIYLSWEEDQLGPI